MSDKTKIDVSGTIRDTAEDAIQSIIGMLVVAILFTCLIAPFWAKVFETHYMYVYNVDKFPERRADVNAKMIGIKIILWLAAIISWAAVLGSFVASGRTLPFLL